MFIKLLPSQVPQLWNQIKFAALKTDRLDDKDKEPYLNKLLAALLSDKAQCFIRLSEDRTLLAIVITRITADEISGAKALLINCLYSFQGVQDQEWIDDLEIIKGFARKVDCKKIITFSNNQRVFDLASTLGFNERYRSFGLEV
jgi:hypothetical protein